MSNILKFVNSLKYTFSITLITIVLASCNNEKPQNSELLKQKITKENLITLSNKLIEDKNISPIEIDYFMSYLNDNGRFKDSIFGKTINEIIQSQKSKDLKNKQVTLNQIAKKTTFNHTFAILVDEIKPFDEEGKKPVNLFIYQMSNMGSKTIKQVEGFIEFYDAQSTLIKKYGVNMEYNLEPGKAVTQQFPYDHDSDNPRDIYIRTNYKNTIIVWNPVKMKFADGSVIDLSL